MQYSEMRGKRKMINILIQIVGMLAVIGMVGFVVWMILFALHTPKKK